MILQVLDPLSWLPWSTQVAVVKTPRLDVDCAVPPPGTAKKGEFFFATTVIHHGLFYRIHLGKRWIFDSTLYLAICFVFCELFVAQQKTKEIGKHAWFLCCPNYRVLRIFHFSKVNEDFFCWNSTCMFVELLLIVMIFRGFFLRSTVGLEINQRFSAKTGNSGFCLVLMAIFDLNHEKYSMEIRQCPLVWW